VLTKAQQHGILGTSILLTRPMLKEILNQLGFTDKEIEVYLAILESGKVTPTDVSKLTGINRTTVYSVAKELIKRGIVAEDLGGDNRYLVALPPQDLKTVIQKEEKKLEEKKSLVDKAIGELKNYAKNTKYSVPKIVFIGEDELENYMYKQTPVWNESLLKHDGIYWGFQDKDMIRHYEKWIDWYWTHESTKKVTLQLLSNESAEVLKKKKYPNRKIKFWKETKDFSASTWIAGDYVIMIVTSQRPHYLVEIHDAVLAHNMREVFKGIWKTLK
jgi:sugar-specific transcriptional regulator TrmB